MQRYKKLPTQIIIEQTNKNKKTNKQTRKPGLIHEKGNNNKE